MRELKRNSRKSPGRIRENGDRVAQIVEFLASSFGKTFAVPAAMPRFANEHFGGSVGVILAGGDGTRLQKLTSRIAGDSRPKQFCRILGNKSLLGQTRERLRPVFRATRTMFVVTKTHEPF
jgi:hypothetical protein